MVVFTYMYLTIMYSGTIRVETRVVRYCQCTLFTGLVHAAATFHSKETIISIKLILFIICIRGTSAVVLIAATQLRFIFYCYYMEHIRVV